VTGAQGEEKAGPAAVPACRALSYGRCSDDHLHGGDQVSGIGRTGCLRLGAGASFWHIQISGRAWILAWTELCFGPLGEG
jgi:hypothetical protein